MILQSCEARAGGVGRQGSPASNSPKAVSCFYGRQQDHEPSADRVTTDPYTRRPQRPAAGRDGKDE